MRPKVENKKINYKLRVDEELWNIFKRYSKKKKRKMSSIIQDILDSFLKNNKPIMDDDKTLYEKFVRDTFMVKFPIWRDTSGYTHCVGFEVDKINIKKYIKDKVIECSILLSNGDVVDYCVDFIDDRNSYLIINGDKIETFVNKNDVAYFSSILMEHCKYKGL